MNKLSNLIKKNEENIRTFITSMVLAFGTVFIGKLFAQVIFIWSNIFGWFNLDSVGVQMNFCLHTTIIIFILATFFMSFIIDGLILKKKYALLSRKIYWILLLIIVLLFVIGHYRTINAMGTYEEVIFEKFKYVICF